MKIKEIILSISHVRSLADLVIGFIVASVAAIFGYFKVIILDHSNLFEAITWVVLIDFFVGVSLAIKNDNFKTEKALKLTYYFGVYFVLCAMVLKVEEGFPSAFWLSEAVIMPILVFQVVSILKNLSLIGLLNNTLLNEMLNKIDKHKDGNAS